MIIKRIRINNFRSLANVEFDVENLNIFVGNNDTGKSNILKALNLFFNGKTDHNKTFDFKDDFSKYPITKKKKADEIEIVLTFKTPQSFKETRDLVWVKKWRRETATPSENKKKYSDGSELEGRRKVGFWLDIIKYYYVPAIKGNEYFGSLLCDLYDVLSKTIEGKLKEASKNFIKSIREETLGISNGLMNKLGLDSKLQIPSDLSLIFEVLDFQTRKGENDISLKFRGDGIKVRHIPIILKFISEQKNVNKNRGAIKSETIWGYEEPENNLELSAAFENANEFLDYSKTIQIFLTTHSPSFYSITRKNRSEVFIHFIKAKEENKNLTTISKGNPESISLLDNEMGLLPFVTPYIESTIKEKKDLENKLKNLEDSIELINKPVIFVEGMTDVEIYKKAFDVFNFKKSVEIKSDSNAGYNWVKNSLLTWKLLKKKEKAAGIFDGDIDAKKAKKDIDKQIESNSNIKTFKIECISLHKTIFKKGIIFPISIEELFPIEIRKYAQRNGWLEDRSNILEYNKSFIGINKSFVDFCKAKGLSSDDLLYAIKKVKMKNKTDFAKHVVSLDSNLENIFQGFDEIINKLSNFFK